jgi:D-amino-acid dehydrogenase
MKVVVLGAGVIGVATAHYLGAAGHEVTVIDRQPGPGLETSFANAGEISPGYAAPWAAPGIPQKAIKWLLMKHSPLILRPRLDVEMLGWLASLLRNCTSARYALNKERMVRLAEFSRDQLIELRVRTGIEYDQRMRGTLQVFKTQRQLDAIGKDVEVLKAGEVPYEIMSRERCVSIEPGLGRVANTIVGGLYLPNDETGDCFQFTTKLATIAATQGVTFLFGTRIEQLLTQGDRVSSVRTNLGEVRADAFVVALGSYSSRLLRPLGIRLPVYPVKGYSITVPIIDEERAPQSTLMDETHKVAITRLGQRIRVGGMAEISGFDSSLCPKRRATLEYSLSSLFPGAGDLGTGTFWSGLRPMTPDGTPIIGASRLRNLFLNTGHGTLGWTMACGSGHVVANLISGKPPAIDTTELSIGRYGQPSQLRSWRRLRKRAK